MAETTVLIIDDEPLIVKSTCLALQLFGYQTLSAPNGDLGLRIAAQAQPDVILLDIMMPGLDGWTVLSRLKSDKATAGIPVIVFTAREYANGSTLAAQKGAAGFLAKPFEPAEVHEMIQNITATRRD